MIPLKWDQWVLILSKLFRMVAYGQTAIIFVAFLASLGWSDEAIGLFITLTLVGDLLASIAVGAISHTNRVGGRGLLAASCVLLLVSGILFATSSHYLVLLFGAVVGVVSPSGDEVGPFVAIEGALLARLTPYEQRGYLFAIQGMVGTFGSALGMVSGGWIAENAGRFGVDGYRLVFGMYGGWGLLTLLAVLTLSPRQASERVASEPERESEPLLNPAGGPGQRARRAPPALLSLIFGIDSLAYGFMPNSWLVEYMYRRFDASSTVVGEFMFFSQFISALTALPSVWITESCGPVLAIALTKFGAGAFGAAVPLAPGMPAAMASIFLRSLFDTMDVVPRQLFLTSVVPPEQTVAVLALVNMVKTFARALAPLGTGLLAAREMLWVAFVIMGALEYVFGGAVLGLGRLTARA